ncbi:amidohydrolase family protein [Asticcacaulis solisilvae]|uniref:amidohydrolase family protein n=1 Tax=Asticcacaulis solisilvae TaxID=1217274 RepID=UPI003FD85156
MIVDSHQHLWRIGQNGHEWPTSDLPAIHRDFVTADLVAEAGAAGVDATVLVQSQPSDADTDWMLDIADGSPLIQGVVGWADLAAPDAPQRLATLAKRPRLKGIRPMLQGLADDQWILSDAVRPGLEALLKLGLRFDALVFTRHLAAIDRLAKTFPDLPIIIDHCAKPPIASDDLQGWREAIARVADNANVTCKLSGLFTEMRAGQNPEDATPVADHVLSVFGAERLMWGSDWPVVLLRRPYGAWLDWTKAWLGGKTADIHTAVLGKTARRVYALP